MSNRIDYDTINSATIAGVVSGQKQKWRRPAGGVIGTGGIGILFRIRFGTGMRAVAAWRGRIYTARDVTTFDRVAETEPAGEKSTRFGESSGEKKRGKRERSTRHADTLEHCKRDLGPRDLLLLDGAKEKQCT